MNGEKKRARLDQRRAPIHEALENFRQMRVVPFDVPGHKRGRGNPELTAFLGQQCVGVDVNSMKPLDNLCHPVSVIREAEELAADAFGAAHAFLMVGGTTSSVQSMVLTACKRGDEIILPRNVHRSVMGAMVLCGAVFAAFFARLAWMQFVRADYYADKAAEAKAEDTAKNSMTEIALAGKQAVARIKEEISSLIAAESTFSAVKAANLDPEFVKAMLLSVARNWNGASSSKVELQALLPEAERAKFDAAFAAAAKELLEAGIEVGYSKEVRTGFKVGAKGGSYYISFSDDDFEALLKEYLRGKISELLFKA